MKNKAEVLARIDQVLVGGVVPHNTALGLRSVDCGPNWATVELPYAEKLVGNPETGVLHGGAITSLLDGTCGIAIFLAMKNAPRIATIDLRIDYLSLATPGRSVLGRAECYKITHHVAFARAVAYHDDPNDPLANATGTFMIFHEQTSPSLTGGPA